MAGNTTAAILARVGTATALTPALTTVLGGTNDVGDASTGSQTVDPNVAIANLTSIYQQLSASGSQIIAGTVPPRLNADFSALNSTQLNFINTVNAFIRSKPTGVRAVADWNQALSTGDGITPNLSLFGDHVHPNSAGQQVMGTVLAPLL